MYRYKFFANFIIDSKSSESQKLKTTDFITKVEFEACLVLRAIKAYRYGFQNQEHDNELWSGAVSYKYRVEDPRLGRFFSVDPLAAKYPHNSVYAFSENRVIDGVELEGLEYQTAGKYYKDTYIPPQDNLVSRYNLDNYVRADYFQVDPPMDISSPRSIADNISPAPSDDSYEIEPKLSGGLGAVDKKITSQFKGLMNRLNLVKMIRLKMVLRF
jgi:RHS repeat-associated protein